MKELMEILEKRYEYSDDELEMLRGDLGELDASLMLLLEKWKSDENYSDITEYSGYSLDSLRRDYGMNFIAALLTLNWIIKDPKQAVPAIESGIM